MNEAKMIVDLVFKYLSDLSEEDITKLLTGEYELVCKPTVISDTITEEEILEEYEIQNICNFIENILSKEQAIQFMEESKFTRDKLIKISKYFEIYIPKNYNKGKIMDKIADSVVGRRLD